MASPWLWSSRRARKSASPKGLADASVTLRCRATALANSSSTAVHARPGCVSTTTPPELTTRNLLPDSFPSTGITSGKRHGGGLADRKLGHFHAVAQRQLAIADGGLGQHRPHPHRGGGRARILASRGYHRRERLTLPADGEAIGAGQDAGHFDLQSLDRLVADRVGKALLDRGPWASSWA